MLDALRRGAGTWVAKLFLSLLVLSFAVWGIADVFRGYRGDAMVTIGKTEISGERYRYELQGEMQAFGRRLGRPLTLEEARALGVDAQVLGRMITEAALDENARRLGLNMSDDAVATAITTDPQFQTPGGTFDRGYFVQVLRATGQSEGQFVAERRATLLRQAIGNALSGGAAPSQTLLDAVNTYANETRAMDYFVIGADDLDPVGEPDEAALMAYFDAHKGEFAAPEYRKLAIISIEPGKLAPTIEITDDEARQEYESRKDRYQTPERRTVRQIVFQDRAEADAALADIRAGKTFDDIATARGLKDGETELGTVTRDGIVDPKVADAVFALAAGTVSDVIEGQFGFVLATVSAIEPGTEKSFEEVKAEIIAALQLSRAEGEVLDLHDAIEDARAAGQTLAEIAAAKKLELIAVDAVDAAGLDKDGNPVATIPAADVLLREAFQSDVGLENDPIQLRGSSFAWYDVEAIEPKRDRTLDEVRGKAVAAWKQSEETSKLEKAATDAVDAISKGEPVTAVASRYHRSVTTLGGLKRTDTSGPAGEAAVSRLFLLPQGGAAQAAAADGKNRIVFMMAGSTVPPADPQSELAKAATERLSLAQSNDILAQYTAGLREEYGVKVNPEILNRILGETQ